MDYHYVLTDMISLLPYQLNQYPEEKKGRIYPTEQKSKMTICMGYLRIPHLLTDITGRVAVQFEFIK